MGSYMESVTKSVAKDLYNIMRLEKAISNCLEGLELVIWNMDTGDRFIFTPELDVHSNPSVCSTVIRWEIRGNTAYRGITFIVTSFVPGDMKPERSLFLYTFSSSCTEKEIKVEMQRRLNPTRVPVEHELNP